jgi:hypothetical protein
MVMHTVVMLWLGITALCKIPFCDSVSFCYFYPYITVPFCKVPFVMLYHYVICRFVMYCFVTYRFVMYLDVMYRFVMYRYVPHPGLLCRNVTKQQNTGNLQILDEKR